MPRGLEAHERTGGRGKAEMRARSFIVASQVKARQGKAEYPGLGLASMNHSSSSGVGDCPYVSSTWA